MIQQRLSALGGKRKTGSLAGGLLFWVPIVLLGVYMYAALMARFRGLLPDLAAESRDILPYRNAGE